MNNVEYIPYESLILRQFFDLISLAKINLFDLMRYGKLTILIILQNYQRLNYFFQNKRLCNFCRFFRIEII